MRCKRGMTERTKERRQERKRGKFLEQKAEASSLKVLASPVYFKIGKNLCLLLLQLIVKAFAKGKSGRLKTLSSKKIVFILRIGRREKLRLY